MIVETTQEKATAAASKSYINLEHHQYLKTVVMDMKTNKNRVPNLAEPKRVDYHRRSSFSQGHGKRMFSISYFTVESLLLLLCLTASLLLLPLILPPLPPPPLMLLFVPICILVVLMILAFSPSKVRDVTYAYV